MADPWSQFPDFNGVAVAKGNLAFDPWSQFPDGAASGSNNLPLAQIGAPIPPGASDQGAGGRELVLRRSPTPTPDAPTWLGRRIQDIEGKQDPLYADVPSVFSENRDMLQAPMGSAAMLGANDDQMTDVIKKQLGDRYIDAFKDANGYPIISFRDDNGQTRLGYVNKPGLDREDVVRGVKGTLPYAAESMILGPLLGGYSLLSRMLFSGGVGAATSVGGDYLTKPLGNEQGVDPGKAIAMGMAGPLGEVGGDIGARLWNRFVTIPKYFDASSGQLTPAGKQAAQSFGLDPDQLSGDAISTFGKTYAMSPADAKAAVDAGNFDFNLPATRGQLAKDPQQLLQEKAMRAGVYGIDAKNIIEDLDKRQSDAVVKALTETIPARLAGQPWRGAMPPEVPGSNISLNFLDAIANAKAAEKNAWSLTSSMTPKTEVAEVPNAMTPMTGVNSSTQRMSGTQLLKDTLRENLTPFSGVISPENTPTAFNMWSYLNEFMAGRKPSTVLHQSLGLGGNMDIDSVRRAIGLMSSDAKTATDREAAKAIYRGYNQWIDRAADASLLHGDTVAAAHLRAARDISREMNGIFNPERNGKLTPGGKLLEQIRNSADTPERVVSALIPTPNGEIRPGTIEALNLIKSGMQRYGNPGAQGQVWNSIKMAYLSKLTQGRGGDFLSPTVMAQNLRKAMNGQSTLFQTIFSPGDRAVINRFLTQLDRVSWKDPNPSGTATSVFGLGRQLFGKIFEATGPLGRAIWDFSGIQHAWGSAIARRAAQQTPAVLPALAGNGRMASLPLLFPFVQQSTQQPLR